MIPSKYFEKNIQVLNIANSERLAIRYKLPNASICNSDICIPQTFVIVKDLAHAVILESPFIYNLFRTDKTDHNGISTSKFGKTNQCQGHRWSTYKKFKSIKE